MSKDFNGLKKEYRPRSGQIAVELGFITKAQLKEAISEQVDDDLSHSPTGSWWKYYWIKDG